MTSTIYFVLKLKKNTSFITIIYKQLCAEKYFRRHSLYLNNNIQFKETEKTLLQSPKDDVIAKTNEPIVASITVSLQIKIK